ncbi:HDOD domain-containing protein [Endozoicomonas sp. SM1973]|uniref:HDOD domain-containing protein n=1 Tax=Spartinivicinus marinus TaxID=2994442 RepID=A0A853ICY3_9GAMM|nr:HDOD domain-containing protein [Spartinivicinus marinus]MCX4025515.1 HDOD domain-containing protein [Spartinivicinus marinus]NYZ65256.1 HDOD domain-containing protein [Spartinivicinus marinus]
MATAPHIQIAQQLEQGKRPLPRLPETVVTIRQIIANPSHHQNDIIQLLEQDPVLVDQLMKLADSPLFHQATSPADLRGAIQRLGEYTVSNFVLTYTIKKLFPSDSKLAKRFLAHYWQRSIALSAISTIMAKHIPQLSTDEAMLASLLQDAGSMLLIINLAKEPNLLASEKKVKQMCRGLNNRLTSLLLNHWHMPITFIEAVKHRTYWQYAPQQYDLTCHCILARYLWLTHQTKSIKLIAIDELPAYQLSPLVQHQLPDHTHLMNFIYQDACEMTEMLGGQVNFYPQKDSTKKTKQHSRPSFFQTLKKHFQSKEK